MTIDDLLTKNANTELDKQDKTTLELVANFFGVPVSELLDCDFGESIKNELEIFPFSMNSTLIESQEARSAANWLYQCKGELEDILSISGSQYIVKHNQIGFVAHVFEEHQDFMLVTDKCNSFLFKSFNSVMTVIQLVLEQQK